MISSTITDKRTSGRHTANPSNHALPNIISSVCRRRPPGFIPQNVSVNPANQRNKIVNGSNVEIKTRLRRSV